MKKTAVRKWIIALTAVLIVLCAGAYAFYGSAGKESAEDAARSIEETVRERALQCYVIEGAYPVDLAYLEENYGLTLNHGDYLVVYDIFAENLPPTVKVIARHAEKEQNR